MKQSLVITSIANDHNPILKTWAKGAKKHNTDFILIGDEKSPINFSLKDCDYYSASKQRLLGFELARELPFNHYSRKNIGYLLAMAKGSEVIIESDDDNKPIGNFWDERLQNEIPSTYHNEGWINVYRFFSSGNYEIWARGFPLEYISKTKNLYVPVVVTNKYPIWQGLANYNPDVDAIYRMTSDFPVTFRKESPIVLTGKSYHPFNSQNTTWFKESFPLLYLPSYCSFRMTDIWRSFVAQRICQEFGWGILYHNATVIQERNDHNLLNDFKDEIPGYLNNAAIMERLQSLELTGSITDMLITCYRSLVDMGIIGANEMHLLNLWINDIKNILK
jgi:hypothetical protein